MGVFEGYTQMNYGDPDHMVRFEFVKSIFPENFTMKDIVSSFFKSKLIQLQYLRSVFPLFYQLIIFILDYTLDSVDTMKAEEKIPMSEIYQNIITKQDELIKMMNDYITFHKGDLNAFKNLYQAFTDYNNNQANKLIPELEKEADGEKKWTFTKFIRTIFSVLSLVSIASLAFNAGNS